MTGPTPGRNQRGEVAMIGQEVRAFIASARTATLATVGPTGVPHLVAMWFALLDGEVWFETKAKSQKAVNLRRNPGLCCLLEAGDSYPALRGVALEGTAEIVEDPEVLWRIGVSLHERYVAPYDDSAAAQAAASVRNRIAVRLQVARVRSWDHRKLSLPDGGPGGSTWPPP